MVHLQKKQNKSGSTVSGSKHIKTIGCSSDSCVIEEMMVKGQQEIDRLIKQQSINFDVSKELELIDIFFNRIEAVALVGPELLLGKLFDQIGFNAISDELFRHLVITRLFYPVSKLKTTDYLFKYKGVTITVDAI